MSMQMNGSPTMEATSGVTVQGFTSPLESNGNHSPSQDSRQERTSPEQSGTLVQRDGKEESYVRPELQASLEERGQVEDMQTCNTMPRGRKHRRATRADGAAVGESVTKKRKTLPKTAKQLEGLERTRLVKAQAVCCNTTLMKGAIKQVHGDQNHQMYNPVMIPVRLLNESPFKLVHFFCVLYMQATSKEEFSVEREADCLVWLEKVLDRCASQFS
jgi:hypothetical protein